MQIQISWLLKKPADLDLHCLHRFSRTRVNTIKCLLSISVFSDSVLEPLKKLFLMSSVIFKVSWKLFTFIIKGSVRLVKTVSVMKELDKACILIKIGCKNKQVKHI